MSKLLDHRQLADEMEIYFLDEQIGAGLPVWLPNGVAIREALEKFVKHLEHMAGYVRVVSPHIAKSDLYERSGHLRAFQGDMYPPMKWPEDGSHYYLKPMNCPHHHKVFASSLRSYRQLPLRVAEYGQVYRFENSGSLKGLSRVRGLCQNDAHIYLDPKDVFHELQGVLDMHEKCYKSLGLKGYRYRLSKCDPNRMERFDGPPELWMKSEEFLRKALDEKRLQYFEAIGEAAFYGPKIDVQMPMVDGREESIASVQVDFNSAEKFNLEYVSASGAKERPWIIHRAPLGSHERLVALLLDFYQGQFPGWLAPVQVQLIPIGEDQRVFADALGRSLKERNIRVQVDHSSGSLSKRILWCHRVRPFAKVILGSREVESGQFVVDYRGHKESVSQSDLVDQLLRNVGAPNV